MLQLDPNANPSADFLKRTLQRLRKI